MATNGASAREAFAPVLAALNTMQSNVERAQKGKAHEYLEKFQKSAEAWTTTITILQAEDTSPEAKLFAATTLKGKIVYDLHQLPRESLPSLRDTLLQALFAFRSGPKPIRMQLCVCLANLAIQMTEWKDVLPLVISKLGSDPQGIPCVLDFLRVLPEEVTDGRKINLSEDDLFDRTKELVEDNAQQVLALLVQYSQSSDAAAKNPQLLDCITSWLTEVAINDIVNSPILKTVFNALSAEEPFESAVECLCSIFRETREVDECKNVIQILYPSVVGLRTRLREAAAEEDAEVFKGISRIFAEAGEAWVVLIAREPDSFRGLVEAILEIAGLDTDRDVISFTFNFWYELKQLIVLENFMQARLVFADIYSKLVDVMIRHLEFPKPEDGEAEGDLFEGDREQEEKFREFRHKMGDVLKDCCEVIGVTECLKKSYDLIENWVQQCGQQAAAGQVPEWQKLEAPLFSMRAMGRMVTPDENIMLPRLVPLIVGIPDQEKVRFQAVMTLGRYTEWTAEHPDLLKPQLDFIMAAFDYPSTEVVRAAALSFKFFCNDCADLLKEYITQIQQFYAAVLNKLPSSSQEEITDGVASVLARLPAEQVYSSLKSYCDPIMSDIMTKAPTASSREDQEAVADKIQLITLFIQYVQPYVEPNQEHPAVKYCQEIFPIFSTLAQNFSNSTPILEHVCRCWRYMVLSYRTALKPLLPELAQNFASGFSSSRHSSFLWATDAVIREFSEGVDDIGPEILHGVFQLYEQQATTFLRAMNDLPPEELPDIIEDFFRLSLDALLYYSDQTICSTLMPSILSAACSALTLLKADPLTQTLHFLRDFLLYGGEFAPSSDYNTSERKRNSPAIQQRVQQLIAGQGEQLVQRIMTGMMYTFPRDCIPDASGVLLELFPLMPSQIAVWVQNTVSMLPAGSITPQESQKFLVSLKQRIESNELQKVRTLLQDFTSSYRRRNVAPREGLGRLEATRFRFSG